MSGHPLLSPVLSAFRQNPALCGGRGGVWTLDGGYAVLPGRPVEMDVFGGLRYAGVHTSTDWQLTAAVTGPGGGQTFPRGGNISERMDLWDGIFGVKGRVWLGRSNWSVPYYLDAGGGTSNMTWQGMLGIAYAWKWSDVSLTSRPWTSLVPA